MYGPNIFAVLTAHDHWNEASSAMKLPHNSKWFHNATGGVDKRPTIDSREPTPPVDENLLTNPSITRTTDRLVIDFDRITNPINGLQFGTDPVTSHVLLGYRGTRGISHKQCNILVDEDLRIFLYDNDSSYGTSVSYGPKGHHSPRRHDSWILAFPPGTSDAFGDITIQTGHLIMRIEFPNHAKRDDSYLKSLRNFAERCEQAAKEAQEIRMDEANIDGKARLKVPYKIQTPSKQQIYLEEKTVGNGSFGQVVRLIRVRDGKFVAGKKFESPVMKEKRGEADPAFLRNIKREFSIIRQNPHRNIVRVFELKETPEPMIVMAYHPAGNMANLKSTNEELYITAMGQILDGLDHLHNSGIAHRDLKPENILVEDKPQFRVVITDFGFAKFAQNSTWLKTFCGTAKYMAPEIFPSLNNGHDSKVDIWSLGVVVLEWMYGIPRLPKMPQPSYQSQEVADASWYEWSTLWTRLIMERIEDEEDGQLVEILSNMIRRLPKDRWPAATCLEQGFQNGLFKRAVDGLVVCSNEAMQPELSIEYDIEDQLMKFVAVSSLVSRGSL